MKDYFKEDEYWKKHLNDKLEDDLWIEEYKDYLNGNTCLDLGCGIGQFTKWFLEKGYDVISADISSIALEKVKEFNNDVIRLDMRDSLPFEDKKFDIVFANLSIHYFSDLDTKRLISEVKRVLKSNGLFIGTVNSIQGFEEIKDTAEEIEYHYYHNRDKYIRLFDVDDVKNYFNAFDIIKIDEKETIRFDHKKSYIIFIVKG